MVRGLALLSLLAGCDYVLGLERPLRADSEQESPTHDEDGDGIADRYDLCPHLAVDQLDLDDDGIGNDCDPRVDEADHGRYFFAFEDGDHGRLDLIGVATGDKEATFLGSETFELSALVLGVSSTTATIVAAVTIADAATGQTSELDLLSASHGFTPDVRGDNCLIGRDSQTFFEYNEDAADVHDQILAVGLKGLHGTFTLARSPTHYRCAFIDPDLTIAHEGERPVRTVPGGIAVATRFAKVKLDYLWIVTPDR
jgi:hypothetical protein